MTATPEEILDRFTQSQPLFTTGVAVSRLLGVLQQRRRWLLIFDNAEEPAALAGYLPGGKGHVLITSRNPHWQQLAAPLPVDVFTPTESRAVLRAQVPRGQCSCRTPPSCATTPCPDRVPPRRRTPWRAPETRSRTWPARPPPSLPRSCAATPCSPRTCTCCCAGSATAPRSATNPTSPTPSWSTAPPTPWKSGLVFLLDEDTSSREPRGPEGSGPLAEG